MVADRGAWAGGTAPSCASPPTKYSGTLAAMTGNVALGTFAGGEKHRYQFSVTLDSSAGNAYQGGSSSYACSFDTTAVADGLVDLRATATDSAGYARTSVAASRRIGNSAPTVSITNPGSPLQNTVTLTGTATDTAPASPNQHRVALLVRVEREDRLRRALRPAARGDRRRRQPGHGRGAVRVRIVITLANGRRVPLERTFHPCVAGHQRLR